MKTLKSTAASNLSPIQFKPVVGTADESSQHWMPSLLMVEWADKDDTISPV
jgi:hypothetical protein